MLADIKLIVLPYATLNGKSLLDILIKEFNKKSWTQFRAAIAFIKQRGIYDELLDSMIGFVKRGNSIEMTFGADTFNGDVKGSEYKAIEKLFNTIGQFEKVKLFLYHEKSRTFHPKLYVFSNEKRALLIIGSSNWGPGGLRNNVELNVKINLNLSKRDQIKCYNEILRYFNNYWQEGK